MKGWDDAIEVHGDKAEKPNLDESTKAEVRGYLDRISIGSVGNASFADCLRSISIQFRNTGYLTDKQIGVLQRTALRQATRKPATNWNSATWRY